VTETRRLKNHILQSRKITKVCTNSSSARFTLDERRKFVSLLAVAEVRLNVSESEKSHV